MCTTRATRVLYCITYVYYARFDSRAFRFVPIPTLFDVSESIYVANIRYCSSRVREGMTFAFRVIPVMKRRKHNYHANYCSIPG